MLKDFMKRLTSRKFLLAVGTALTAYANGDYTAALAAIGLYIGVEGLADIVAAFAKFKYLEPAKLDQQTQLINSGDLELDKEPKVIVPGQP
jgi:hypothetical protein